jgi:hypothetical protein
MNQTQFIDELEKRGLTKKEAVDGFKKLDQSRLSKTFFPSFGYLAPYPNGVTPKISILRTESLCGEVHVLALMQHTNEKVRIAIKSNDRPLLLLRLFVATGAPPESFRYTGSEPLYAIDVSLPDCGYLPEEIGEERICLLSSFLWGMKNLWKGRIDTARPQGIPADSKVECDLLLYSFRPANVKEREAVFALYNVKARTAEEYNPKKTKQNPKGAGRTPIDEKKDDKILTHWNKERAIDGKLPKKQFWKDYYQSEMTLSELKATIDRTQKRRNRRLKPKRR